MRCPSVFFALPALLFISSSIAIPAQSDIAGLIKAGQIDPQVFDPSYVHFDCGNTIDHASDDLLQSHQQLHADKHRGSAVGRRAKPWFKRQWTPVVVPVYMHIVTTADKANSVPDNMYQAQLATMNQKYHDTGFQFRLDNVTRTTNDAWATAGTFGEMQTALRQGAYGALNIYFLSARPLPCLRGQCVRWLGRLHCGHAAAEHVDVRLPGQQGLLSVAAGRGCGAQLHGLLDGCVL